MSKHRGGIDTSKWYNKIPVPEIGVGGMVFLSIVTFIGGVIIGTNLSLWIQFGLLVLFYAFLSSWSIRRLEMGAFAYLVAFFTFFLGLVVGDISYYLQVRPDIDVDIDWFRFWDLFKAR